MGFWYILEKEQGEMCGPCLIYFQGYQGSLREERWIIFLKINIFAIAHYTILWVLFLFLRRDKFFKVLRLFRGIWLKDWVLCEFNGMFKVINVKSIFNWLFSLMKYKWVVMEVLVWLQYCVFCTSNRTLKTLSKTLTKFNRLSSHY